MIAPLFVGTCAAAFVLLAGGAATRTGPWFRALRRPRWNPPDWLFGPIWTTIAILAVWSAAEAWTRAPDAHIWIAILFGINALLNMAWSPLFFLMKRPDWALAEVVPFWLSVVALVLGLAPLSMLSAWLLAPYLVWVSIAVLLNLEIVRLNAPFRVAKTGRSAAPDRTATNVCACPRPPRRYLPSAEPRI